MRTTEAKLREQVDRILIELDNERRRQGLSYNELERRSGMSRVADMLQTGGNINTISVYRIATLAAALGRDVKIALED